jgi:hypothetical protein
MHPMGQTVRLFQESYDSNPGSNAVGEFSPKELFLKIKSSLTSSIQMFMPSKKPATLIAIPEERSMSSVSSDSSGISKGMTMALDKFASVIIDGGGS